MTDNRLKREHHRGRVKEFIEKIKLGVLELWHLVRSWFVREGRREGQN